jgi:hypothetical protein
MIVIGSYAAKLGSYLPPYRNDAVRDIDLVCSVSEFVDLVTLTGFQLRQIFPDKYLVLDAPLVLEINVYPDQVVERMEALCEVQSVQLTPDVELDCYVATPEIVWATLYHRVHSTENVREKSIADLEHYQAAVDQRGLLLPEHEALAGFYHRRILAEGATSRE